MTEEIKKTETEQTKHHSHHRHHHHHSQDNGYHGGRDKSTGQRENNSSEHHRHHHYHDDGAQNKGYKSADHYEGNDSEREKHIVKKKVKRKGKISLFRRQPAAHYRPGLERLRLILMFFLCIDLLGFPSAIGGFVQTFCGFVPIAFFILSGYLVLRESEHRSERILRAIKRTAIVFGALVIVYFILNLIYYQSLGVNIFSAFKSKRVWFNFVVLNIWPFDIGTAIWYVQALLYAYIIIYFLDKWKLLKYDWLIAGVLILFTIITGELAGIIRWSFLGYNSIAGNFLTRALPYILLGCFMHRKYEKFDKLRRRYYALAILAGVILMALEILGLDLLGVSGYYGHLIGMPVIALSVCMLAIKKSGQSGFEKKLGMSRWHINSIYYLCQPVSIGVAVLLSAMDNNSFAQTSGYIGMITFLVCFGIAWLIAYIGRKIGRKKVHG